MCKIGFYRITHLFLIGLLSLHLVGWAGEACTEFVEIDDDILTSQLLLIGERHGTNEIPKAFEGVVCDLLRRGKDVWVGLEIPAFEQEKIYRYLKSPGREEDRKSLTSGVFWLGQDGRGTSSMLALLEKLRTLQTATRHIPVIAIDRLSNSGENFARRRDNGLAELVRGSSVQFAHSTGVVLVGNAHAKRASGESEQGATLPLGYLLADLKPISAIVFHEGGTAWNMVRNKSGVFEIEDTIPLYIANPAQYVHKIKKFTAIPGAPANPNYDALIMTKTISAATPVRQHQE
jgi:hypothetical protein